MEEEYNIGGIGGEEIYGAGGGWHRMRTREKENDKVRGEIMIQMMMIIEESVDRRI